MERYGGSGGREGRPLSEKVTWQLKLESVTGFVHAAVK